LNTEVQEIGAQQEEVGEAAAAADLVAAVARAPQAAAQAATMVAVLRVRAVTKVVGVLLDHLFDRMKPPSTVKNHVLVAVWLTARVAVKMIACAAVAVGLTVVVMVIVLVKVAVQLALVVVQAVGEEFEMTSMAALVVILAVLAEEQMAQMAVRRVATVLGVAQPRSHGPEEGSIPPLPSQERAPYRITRSGKRGRQRYKTKGTVYLPATTVPPTVVALRPKKGGNRCVGPIPLMGIGPRRRPTNTTKYNARQVPQCGK